MSVQKPENQINLIEFIIKCRKVIAGLRSHWIIIFVAGIIGGAAGLTYSYINKPVYTASLSFALEDENEGGFSGALGLASQLGFDLGVKGGGAFSGTNLLELFKSRKMIEKTLLSPVKINGETISFAEMCIRDFGWRENWKNNDKLKKLQFLVGSNRAAYTRDQDSIMGSLYSKVASSNLKVVQKERDIAIVIVEMKSTNEFLAKYFTEALANEVSAFYISTKNQKALDNYKILERQRDSIRQELNSSLLGVAASNDNTFNLNPALNIQRVPSSRRQVDVQVNGAMLTELVKQTELAKVTLRRNTPLIQIIDRPIFPLKMERVGKLKGIVLFGFTAGLIAILFLLLKQFYDAYFSNKD